VHEVLVRARDLLPLERETEAVSALGIVRTADGRSAMNTPWAKLKMPSVDQTSDRPVAIIA
jgi:hypothetical protein